MKKEEYELSPKKCLNCGNHLEWEKRKNKYCNSSCAASKNNIGRRRRGMAPTKCGICGNPTSHHGKYCQSCRYDGYYKEYVDKWLNGEENGSSRCGELHNSARRYLMEISKNRCQKCKWGEKNKFTKKVPITIHHIDGNWKNNERINLSVLCPNCHSLTENYGSRGKGRPKRKEYIM